MGGLIYQLCRRERYDRDRVRLQSEYPRGHRDLSGQRWEKKELQELVEKIELLQALEIHHQNHQTLHLPLLPRNHRNHPQNHHRLHRLHRLHRPRPDHHLRLLLHYILLLQLCSLPPKSFDVVDLRNGSRYISYLNYVVRLSIFLSQFICGGTRYFAMTWSRVYPLNYSLGNW